MAEFTTVTADRLRMLPESVDLRMGALVEPMAVAWHAVRLSGARVGQRALIAGGGPIGLGLWFALQARGVTSVVISEPSAVRREIAEGIGAKTSDPGLEDALSRGPFDVVFDAAGVGTAIVSALARMAPGGRLVVVALHERPSEFNFSQLLRSETSLIGSLAYLPQDFDEVIEAMSGGSFGDMDWVNLLPLEEVVRAMEDLRAGKTMKTLVQL
jgi:(R,R)-butanediol dehydrogenase/meso-butanediol dehydrogenase/diacetyl reductase